MGNLYRVNPFYEWELENFPQKISPPKSLVAKGKSLEYLFLPISSQEDTILFSHPPDSEFCRYLSNHFPSMGSCALKPIENQRLVEWGKYHYLENGQLIPDISFLKEAKILNSKLQQSKWKQEIGLEPADRVHIDSIERFDSYVEKFGYPCVIKKDLGFSGVSSFVVHSRADFMFLLPNIDLKKEIYFIESWKAERILDFSFLFHKEDNLQFLTKTEMYVNSRGVYSGSQIVKAKDTEISFYKDYLDSLFSRFAIPYTGAICIDGFYYKENGQWKVRYMSEINFRFSMGRIAWEISQRKKNVSSFILTIKNQYKHLNLSDTVQALHEKFPNSTEQILLTPHKIETQAVPSLVIYLGFAKEISFENLV